MAEHWRQLRAKPIPADVSLSFDMTAGAWASVHDGAFADRCCHPDEGGICRDKKSLIKSYTLQSEKPLNL